MSRTNRKDTVDAVRVEGLRSPSRVRTSWQFTILAVLAVSALVLAAVGLVWIPWQQSVAGAGRVIVLSPMQRPQNLEATIKARLARWHVQEGQVVEAGELVAELAEVDVKYLDEDQTTRLEAQRVALLDQLTASEGKVSALEGQIMSLEEYRNVSVRAAAQKIEQAAQKLNQEVAGQKASAQNLSTAKANLARLETLRKQGIRSQRDLELAELSYAKAEAELAKDTAAVQVAKQAQEVATLEREKVGAELDAKLSATQAYLAEAREKVAKTRGELQKLDNDLASLRARVEQRSVRAPIAGRVVRLLKVGSGETVKEGDVLAVLAPETTDRAVELFVSGNDAPLVTPGRHVRLQFAGWPALQFSGWPSVAVGTFGGEVAVVDAVDDGAGRFRVLVIPDQRTLAGGEDEPWPEAAYLRPGAKVSGWVMLDVVSLGFELWRQFHGFSPALSTPPTKEGGVKDPVGKVGKKK